MCLGVPGKVVRVLKEGATALVDFGGIVKEVDVSLVPEINVGDYVVVHAGAAISKVDEETALTTLKLWDEIAEVLSHEPSGGSNVSPR